MHEPQPSSRPLHGMVEPLGWIGVLTVFGQHKRLIAGVTLLGLTVGLVVALLLPAQYTARTVLLPPQPGQLSASALSGSIGMLAATAGVSAALKTPEELYVGLLRTDTIADALIRRFDLANRYDASGQAQTRRELAKRSHITVDRKSSLITLAVDDVEPAVAARLVNAYAEELQRLMTRIAVSDAQRRRLYFERQATKAKSDLALAELAVKRAQDKHGLISLDAQTQTVISATAQLRARIVAREVELRAMRPYAGPENPELKRLLSEIASLRTQLAKLEGGSDTPGSEAASDKDSLANLRVFRELKYQEAMYATMLQQLQLAQADEAMDAPLIQQVDVALPPDRRSKPARGLLTAVGAALGLASGLALALMLQLALQAQADPARAQRWHAFQRAWAWRR